MLSDYKRIIMEFRPSGIFLQEIPPPPSPSATAPSALTQAAWQQFVDDATSYGPPLPPSVPHSHLEDLPLSSISFNPRGREHRFDLRQDRRTYISFQLKRASPPGVITPGWLFVDDTLLAFRIKDGTSGAEQFKNTTVHPGREVLTVTYTPPSLTNGGAPPPYSYELRVEAACYEANTNPPKSKGHMIIIIDPVIGSVEV